MKKLTVITSRKWNGKTSSMNPMSLENRFSTRPVAEDIKGNRQYNQFGDYILQLEL